MPLVGRSMLDLCRQAGLVWARDWSLKWQDVEPKKGHFTFAETDAQINRILRQGVKVMSVPGFPSNMWSTTVPASVKRHDPWYETSTKAPDAETQRDEVLYEVGWPFMRMAYPPRDMAQFKNYVAEIVGHYKGRIRDWEVFNESLYTLYSLPQRAGFKMADYLRYQEAFIEAARKANPECRILGGCCYVSERMENPGEFIKLGGLKNIDIFTLHYYPGHTPPEQLEPWFQRLGGMMDQYGIRRPIWITETAYSADDEPWITPANVYLTTPAYLASERMQAEYEVRYNTILLANGVEKIFYHAGTGSGYQSRQPVHDVSPLRQRAVQVVCLASRTGENAHSRLQIRQAAAAGRAASGLSVPRCRAGRGGGLGAGRRESRRRSSLATPSCSFGT